MSLPAKCRRITKEERTISAKALITQNIQDPFFAVYNDSFLDVVGQQPEIHLILEKDYKFAHEAPVYVPDQDAVYFTSAVLRPKDKPEEVYTNISKANRQSDGTWTCEDIETDVSMGNGGINYPAGDGILFCAQGTKTEPGGIVLMNRTLPHKCTTLVDGFHGRLFNSVNDLVTHRDGSIWFTDPIYGYEQRFRGKPQLPSQVYRFDPETGDLRVVADGFGRPNGLCFSPDEQVMYVTDTDWIHGDGSIDPARVGTIYAFDVLSQQGSSSQFLTNRRVFAMADNGIPDGIKCDLQGNVYSGCGDGVNVWDAGGRLVGKIMIPGGVANFCFMRKGELFCLNETRIWFVKISEGRQGALLKNLGIAV